MVEMLTIIALICVIASILLPALSAGVSQAKLSSCANNLRNIAIGTIAYASHNQGMIPDIMPGMNERSIPILRLPNGKFLALGKLLNDYMLSIGVFGCPDSPGMDGIALESKFRTTAMLWSAYLYRCQSNGFNPVLSAPENYYKAWLIDFACITPGGEQFAPHNYLVINMLFNDGHVESQRNSREPFKHYTAYAANHGEAIPDCSQIWANADKAFTAASVMQQ